MIKNLTLNILSYLNLSVKRQVDFLLKIRYNLNKFLERGYNITAIIRVFQTRDTGSTPVTRSLLFTSNLKFYQFFSFSSSILRYNKNIIIIFIFYYEGGK